MRYRPSLYGRLVLVLLGPLLLAMTAAWAIGVGIVTHALERRLESQLGNAADVLASGRLPFTPELLSRLASLQQADFILVDGDGRVAMATSSAAQAATEAWLAQARPVGANRDTRRLELPVRSIAVYRRMTPAPDARYSAVVAIAPLGDAAAAASRATLWLGIAMLAAAAILGAVLLRVARHITQPLARLSAFADRIAAGEREQRLELARADEIGALAHSLNTMMQRLAAYEARITSQSRMSALGEMSARLAHEIRNPLTGLKLHLQLLAERVAPTESSRVERLLTEVERLELLVSSTLLLGGDQPLQAAQTDVSVLVTEVLDLMGPSLAHRGIAVESRCEDDLQARVDRGRVRQALLNLIVNAADAMPQGGSLRVSGERDPAASRVRIVVEDSGPGVPDDVRARLAEASVSTKPFGLGLGITLCREVARAHGGELVIERSATLGGARFVMALPFVPVASPQLAHD